MSLGALLLIALSLVLLGVFPTWQHSQKWGYSPAGGVALLLLIVSVLWVADRL